MITFSQFIAEAKTAPIYHGTALEYADNILRIGFVPSTYHSSNRIYIGQHQKQDPKGVSFTRNLALAKAWGTVILEVNQQELSHNYKIVPVQYFHTRNMARSKEHLGKNNTPVNEFEEFVITEKPILPKYIK